MIKRQDDESQPRKSNWKLRSETLRAALKAAKSGPTAHSKAPASNKLFFNPGTSSNAFFH